jgi:hypothetical protein
MRREEKELRNRCILGTVLVTRHPSSPFSFAIALTPYYCLHSTEKTGEERDLVYCLSCARGKGTEQ